MKLLTETSIVLLAAFSVASSLNVCSECLCSSENLVYTIDCTQRQISGDLGEPDWPATVPMNTNAVRAIFDHNEIVSLSPFLNIAVSMMSFRHNKIIKFADRTFRNMSQLEYLDLSFNQINSNSLRSNVFEGWYAPDLNEPLPLRVLMLGNNAIHSLPNDVFSHLGHLEELYLDHNPMDVLDLPTQSAITNLYTLKVLDLSGTGLKSMPPTLFYTLTNLETVYLKENQLQELKVDFHRESSLVELDLDGNPIQVLDKNSFSIITNLKTLHISHMPELTRIESETFYGFSSLETLECNYNSKLEFIDKDVFANITDENKFPLKELFLNNNKLQYLDPRVIPDWSRLSDLDLRGNPWVCDCENQWIVTDLIPIMQDKSVDKIDGMVCHEPNALKGKTMSYIYLHTPHLRCLDDYGNEPENDGPILIGVLVGVLLAIPVTLLGAFLWKKRYSVFFRGERGAADYSRAFYKRADQA